MIIDGNAPVQSKHNRRQNEEKNIEDLEAPEEEKEEEELEDDIHVEYDEDL